MQYQYINTHHKATIIPIILLFRHRLMVHWQSFQLNQYEHLFYNNNTTYKYLKHII